MKKLIFIVLMLFSTQGFSTCSDDFNAGLGEYTFASTYFQKGLTAYQAAVELSRQGSSNFLKICNLLVDSVTGFNVSTNSYSNCANSFNSAMTACRGEDSRQASINKGVCLGNKSIASDNHELLRELLKNTCFRRATSLEAIDLEMAVEPLTYE